MGCDAFSSDIWGGLVMESLGMAGVSAPMGIDISGPMKTGSPFTLPVEGQETPADKALRRLRRHGKEGPERHERGRAGGSPQGLEFASPSRESILRRELEPAPLRTPAGRFVVQECGGTFMGGIVRKISTLFRSI